MQQEVRTAIDFGSGALKFQEAVVDLKDQSIVGKPLATGYFPLNLTEDVSSHGGYISEEMKEKALGYLEEIKQKACEIAKAKELPSPNFSAIATAVFRKAKNGGEVLAYFEEILGIKFTILSQDEEGKLGFLTAEALFPKANEEDLLVWDSGNGSFQMTEKKEGHTHVFLGPLGHGDVRLILAKEIRDQEPLKSNDSGCPISKQEALLLSQKIKERIPQAPLWLEKKLQKENLFIATYGEGESIFYITTNALNESKVSDCEYIIKYSEVKTLLESFLGQDQKFFIDHNLHFKTITAMVLLTSVMEEFEIETIHYKKTLGNTSGLLIYQDLWSF